MAKTGVPGTLILTGIEAEVGIDGELNLITGESDRHFPFENGGNLDRTGVDRELICRR